MTLGGAAPEDRDFVHAVYGNFPVRPLLRRSCSPSSCSTRAFRSIVLPLKAVILNLISLACAFGVVVFIFQQGHGSEAIWDDHRRPGVVIAWIPLMIFAFLFGLSMDYEVFMITRIREAYDETQRHGQAISLGLARTGKLVTSARARARCSRSSSLSTGPGLGHQAVRDRARRGRSSSTRPLIRALLVPSLMKLLGRCELVDPGAGTRRVLFVAPRPDGRDRRRRLGAGSSADLARWQARHYTPVVAVTSDTWSPASWRDLPALQQPDWPDQARARRRCAPRSRGCRRSSSPARRGACSTGSPTWARAARSCSRPATAPSRSTTGTRRTCARS